MSRAFQNRVKRLEAAKAARRVTRVAWSSVEAARAAGVEGGFIVVGDVLPTDEWERLAVPYMRELVKGNSDATVH